ncbi:hypothetical protein E2P81_ATG02743 [Venturia nashicola]|nr:hypothetical protein E2P81_ATG02743 [Venturia nashicola]
MEQYRVDSEVASTEPAGVAPIYDAIADELDVIITNAIQQYSLGNEARVEESREEDEDYDADTEIISGTTATEQTTGEEPEAHPYLRSNLTPVQPSIRTPTLPRFDNSAVLGEASYVRRQTRWIDALVAAEKA